MDRVILKAMISAKQAPKAGIIIVIDARDLSWKQLAKQGSKAPIVRSD